MPADELRTWLTGWEVRYAELVAAVVAYPDEKAPKLIAGIQSKTTIENKS